MRSDPKETSVMVQDVDQLSRKHIKNDKKDPSLAAQERQLLIHASKLNFISGMRLTGTSMDKFFRIVGARFTHTEKKLNKKN